VEVHGRPGLGAQAGQRHQNGDSAFVAGKDAITLESTGSLGDFTRRLPGRHGFYPKINASDAGGPIIGGASRGSSQGKDDAHKRRPGSS